MLHGWRLNPFRATGVDSISGNQKLASPPQASAQDRADNELDETIENMNDAAGKTPQRQSPRKRKAAENEDQSTSPAKRRSRRYSRQGTAAAGTASIADTPASRLRSRKSTALRHSIDRKDPFALPVEETEEPVPQLRGSQKPIHKAMRKLGRRGINPSPLNGRGVIEMPAVGVDLLDSPEKRAKKTTRAVLRVARDGSVRFHEVESAMDKGTQDGQTQAAKPLRKSPRKHMAVMSGPGSPAQKRSARKAQKPVPEAGPEYGNGTLFVGAERDESDNDQSAEEDISEAATPEGPGDIAEQSRKDAENIAKRQQQQVEDERLRQEEAEEKRKQLAKLMRGIEDIADLHDCKSNWEEILLNVSKLRDARSELDAESEKGKRLCQRVEHSTRKFQQLNIEAADPGSSQPVSLVKHIHNLERRLDSYEDSEAGEQKRESVRKARDLHQFVVPLLVLLLGAAIKARKDPNGLSHKGYQEIAPLLALSYKAADLACRWEPRPSGLEGIKSLVRHIRKDLREASDKYAQELNRLQWPIEEARRLDALYTRQRLDQDRLDADVARQRERILRARREARAECARSCIRADLAQSSPGRQATETARRPTSSQDLVVTARDTGRPSRRAVATLHHGQQDEAFDLDNLNGSDAVEAPVLQSTARPIPRRQQTEEIPGPVQAKWMEKQTSILIEALQTHTGHDRFQKIVDEHGEQLGERSLDDIVLQAKFIKASLAVRLDSDPNLEGPKWDWLRSVPTD